MAKKKTKASLLDTIHQTPATRGPAPRCWYEYLSEEEQAEMDEIKRAWLAGEISKSLSQVHRIVRSHVSRPMGRTSFVDWIRAEPKP